MTACQLFHLTAAKSRTSPNAAVHGASGKWTPTAKTRRNFSTSAAILPARFRATLRHSRGKRGSTNAFHGDKKNRLLLQPIFCGRRVIFGRRGFTITLLTE